MKTIYITEGQKNIIKESQLLTEENRTQKRKCEDGIRQYCSYYVRPYLDTPLKDAPYAIKYCLSGNDPDNPRLGLYSAVYNNTTGANKVIDFLRLNLYGQFNMGRGSDLFQYVEGIVRIACQDLGFYAFCQDGMQGGKIVKFGKILRLIDFHPEIMMEGVAIDGNLNGLSYDAFMELFKHNYSQYVSKSNNDLAEDTSFLTPHNYRIVEIKDRIGENSWVGPTEEGMRFLRSLEQYTSWCVCGDMAEFEYAQYLSNGGRMYICLKEGFENVPKEVGENCPLDEYGLSMVCVIVGSDGFPDNVTTRWNHENGGENPKGLCDPIHLQKLFGVKYKDIFKPRKAQDLRKMNLAESEEKEGNLLTESIDEHYDYKKDMLSIAKFMKKEGLNVYPFPKVKLNWEEQDGLFIKTGYYHPEEKTIVVFCKDRHPKDILRTFAHEMIHHSQNLDGKDLNFYEGDDVKGNERLEKIEGEAYLKGNIYFRKWTEYMNSHKNPLLNESIEIDPKNKGKFNATKKKTGKSTEELTHSKNPLTRKRAIFAQNAKKWNKKKEIEETIDPKDVDLSSFDIKSKLNPKFWKDERLDSRIRMKLLDIADDFIDFLKVNWVKPEDIVITGSLANFNWDSKYSDIDLHVIMDFSKVDKRKDFVKSYFDSQKKLWNEDHKDLKIFGFPIEVYVQDKDEENASKGVYSLDKDEWLLEPKRKDLTKEKIDKKHVTNTVATYVNKIDGLLDIYKKYNKDSYEMRKVSDDAKKIFDDIKKERTDGLRKDKSEMSDGNVIFKCLRRMGYIEKIVNLKHMAYDKLNSLS